MKIQTIICSAENGDIYVTEDDVLFVRFADLTSKNYFHLGFRGKHPNKRAEVLFELLDKAYHISYLSPGGALNVDFEVDDNDLSSV